MCVLKRKHAVFKTLEVTFIKPNKIIRDCINCFLIGSIKQFINKFGQWLRYNVRIIIKQGKKITTNYRNLQKINQLFKFNFTDEDIFNVANSRMVWYRRCGMNEVNYILKPEVLSQSNKKKEKSGLVNSLNYYISSLCKI